MPVDLWEETLELPCFAKGSETAEPRAFTAVLLENPFVKVTVLPEFAIVTSIVDKLANRELLVPIEAIDEEDTLDDARSRGGIRLGLKLTEPTRAVHTLIRPHDEAERATLWLMVNDPRMGLTCHFGLSLAPNEAAIAMDVRAYKRDAMPSGSGIPIVYYAPAEPNTLALVYDDHQTIGAVPFGPTWTPDSSDDSESLYPAGDLIAPHRLSTGRHWWVPVRGLDTISDAGRWGALAIGVDPDGAYTVQICATQTLTDHRLVVQPFGKPSQAMRVDLYPEKPSRTRLTKLPSDFFTAGLAAPDDELLLKAMSAKTPDQTYRRERTPPEPAKLHREITAMRMGHRIIPPAVLTDTDHIYLYALDRLLFNEPCREWFIGASRDLRWTSLCYYHLGINETRAGRLKKALTYFEEALLYNGGDVKAWLMRAAIFRKLFMDEEAAEERLNVHFLTPLEPLLRAEAFLGAPDNDPEADPGALLKPFDGDAETYFDIASFYLEAGFPDDAARILLEGVKRCPPNAMFHYLLAYSYGQRENLKGMAADQLAQARKITLKPGVLKFYEERAIALAIEMNPDDQQAADAFKAWRMAAQTVLNGEDKQP